MILVSWLRFRNRLVVENNADHSGLKNETTRGPRSKRLKLLKPHTIAILAGLCLLLSLAIALLSVDADAPILTDEQSITVQSGAKPEAPDQNRLPEEEADHEIALANTLTGIQVSFKVDPRITKGLYMGERWVSPPTYASAQEGNQFTVDAKAQGVNAQGKPVDIMPEWTPADPDMVRVTPAEGRAVKITVQRTGQSSLEVASLGFSKQLTVDARQRAGAIFVELSQ